MKKITFIPPVFLLLISPFLASGQEIKVEPINERMQKGKQPGFAVTIPEAERRPIKREWKRRLKEFENEDVDKSHKQVTGKHIVIPDISNHPLNIYTKLSEVEGGVRLVVFFQTSEVKFLSSSHPGFDAAKKLIRNFAVKKGEEALQTKLREAQSVLENQKNELQNLKDNEEELKTTIEDCRETIKESEKALKKNEKEQKEQVEKVEQKATKVNKIEERLNNLD